MEETEFDVVLLGTGLPQSMLAAALSFAHRKVLHVDCNDFYGAQWASLALREFHSWVLSLPHAHTADTAPSPFFGGSCYSLECSPLDTEPPVSPQVTLSALMQRSRSFCIDLCPRLIFGRGGAVKLLVQCAVGKYGVRVCYSLTCAR